MICMNCKTQFNEDDPEARTPLCSAYCAVSVDLRREDSEYV